MSKFQMLTDERSEEFLELITNDMVELFHITLEEAVGRINREWRDQDFTGLLLIYHEMPDHWAKTIYYGKESMWWIKEENGERMNPLPFP